MRPSFCETRVRPAEEWLEDILGAIERIEEKVTVGQQAFDADPMLQVWVQYHLIIIGEAAVQLNKIAGFCEAHPDIEWKGMRDMRNVITHEYHRVDLDQVWDTVTNDLPVVRTAIERILSGPSSIQRN